MTKGRHLKTSHGFPVPCRRVAVTKPVVWRPRAGRLIWAWRRSDYRWLCLFWRNLPQIRHVFFSLLPDDSKIIPFGSFTHLQAFTDHCRMIYRCRCRWSYYIIFTFWHGDFFIAWEWWFCWCLMEDRECLENSCRWRAANAGISPCPCCNRRIRLWFAWFLPGKRGIHSVQNGILDIISYEPAKLKMLRDNSLPELSKFPNSCTGCFPLMDPAVTTMVGVCHEVYLLYPVVFEAVLWVRKSRAREASRSIAIYWLFCWAGTGMLQHEVQW